MILGVHHTGLSVHDLEAAIAFYTSEHAFTLHSRFDLADTPTHRAALGVGNAAARGALLTATLGSIELFQFADNGPDTPHDTAVHSAGIRHICLQTEISDRLYDGLVAAGASSHTRPAGLGTGNSYVYIRDPEGNLIELEGTPWAPAGATRPWFAHTAIVAADIDRLTAFYTMLTGVEIHRRGSFGPDAKFDVVAGIADVRFEGAWLRLGNAELEFWQYLAPITLAVPPRHAAAPGWNHLCFESDDVEGDHARLLAAGVELHSSPIELGNALLFFGRDPEGNLFEVLQPRGPTATSTAALLAEDQGRLIDEARTGFRASVGG